jgi:biopolymer transport protein ExbB
MEEKKIKSTKKFQLSAGLVVVCCFVIAFIVFEFVLGDSSNFQDGSRENHPLNLMGTIWKGGPVVVILQALFLSVIVLSVERFFAISKAQGSGSMVKFVQSIKDILQTGNIAEAQEICAKQRGSVANVVNSTLIKYDEMQNDKELNKEQKILSIQKELEEATALEMPGLQQNLNFLATMTTLGTLLGLLGTVIGMIRAFAALANAGAPDSIALSTGISEALINTAFGIATGAFAVIFYSFFTSKIDDISYSIDEVGFTIVQTYSATHK